MLSRVGFRHAVHFRQPEKQPNKRNGEVYQFSQISSGKVGAESTQPLHTQDWSKQVGGAETRRAGTGGSRAKAA